MSTYDSASVTYDASTTTYDGYGTQLGIPYLVVEVAFDDGPYVASPTWTDVSSYVRAVSTRRGRTDDLATFTGTATLTLSNRDRRFDPFYTTGPYYGKLLPRRQLRIRAIVGSSTYPVFRGYVAGWPVSYTDAGKDSTVTIECFDALSLLSTEDTPFEWHDYYVKSLNPVNYWKLDDPPGDVITDSVGGLNANYQDFAGVYPERITKSSDLATGLTGGSSTIQRTRYLNSTSVSSAGDQTPTIEIWYKRNLVPSAGTTGMPFTFGGPRNNLAISFRAVAGGDYLDITTNDSTRSMTWTSNLTSFNNTDPQHLVIRASKTAFNVWINGAAVAGTTVFSVGSSLTYSEWTPVSNVNFTYTDLGGMDLQAIAIWNYGLTDAQITALYTFGQGYFRETSTARVNRIITTTSFPTALVSTPASPAATLANITNEADLNSELSTVNASEGGELYVDKSGIVTLTARNSQNTATRSVTTQATFKDTGTDLKYGTSLTIQYDADSIRNEFTYTASDGTVSVEDATSIATYSKNAASITTQLSTKADATTLGNLRLEYFAAPVPAVSPLLVSVTRSTTDWQDLLDLELLDQITVTRTPSVGNAVEVRMLVNTIQHDITPGDWNMTVTGSARYADWFTIDTDYLDGDRLLV